jgi:hypothetical protein
MGNAATDIDNAARSLDGYARRLAKVRTSMNSLDELKSLQNSIASRITAINTAAAIAKNSAVCLNNIRVEYLSAEKKAHLKLNRRLPFKGVITAGIGNVTIPAIRSRTIDPRPPWWRDIIRVGAGVGVAVKVFNWPKIKWPAINWDKIKEWLDRIKPPKPKPGAITKEQERAADRRMQESIQRLQRSAIDKWKNAKTDKERMRILTDFLADVQKVMGTSAKAKINFKNLQYNDKGIALGSYSPGSKQITLNKRLLSKPEGIMLFETVVHEVRHAYQHEAAFGNKHTVSEETRAVWKHNLSRGNYISPGKCFDSYWNQPVEKDARDFSRGRL